jgi:tape measure domain-containing protein
MALGGSKVINQRIALVGGNEVRRELLALDKEGQKAFDDIEKQVDEASRATTGFNKNLLGMRSSFQGVETGIGSIRSSLGGLLGLLGGVAGAFGAAFSIRAISDLTSAWTDLNSRIRFAVGEGEDAAGVMDRLSQIARRTYSSLSQTATAFADNRVVLEELGLSTERQLDLFEAINNALVVSGARGERAASVQTALSKALALGALRGEELNNVIKQGGVIADLLAKQFGVTRGELLQLGQQGKITSDVIATTLLANLDSLRESADAMPATINDAVVQLGDAFLKLIGRFDEATGASEGLASLILSIADGISGLADNIDVIIEPWAKWLEIINNTINGIVQMAAALGLLQTGDDVMRQLGLTSETTAEQVRDAGAAASEMAGELGGAGQAMGTLTATVQDGGAEIEDVFGDLVQNVAGLFDGLGSTVQGIIDGILSAVASAAAAVADFISGAKSSGDSGGRGGSAQRKARGGLIIGPGSSTSDSILTRLSTGEYVVRAAAVRRYGLGMLRAINEMRLPRFAEGGLVGVAEAVGTGGTQLAIPASASTPRERALRPFNLTIGGEVFEGLLAPEAVADKMIRFATGAQVRKTGKAPTWYEGG